jgi:hypothetical protein
MALIKEYATEVEEPGIDLHQSRYRMRVLCFLTKH